MRPFRLVAASLLFALTVLLTFLTLSAKRPTSAPRSTATLAGSRTLHSLFSFHAPASLFPPSAIISLTDDNSTFFLARPAAYGPPLPASSLSGQLWVGAGFADDLLVHGEVQNTQSELGCSDLAGWNNLQDPLLGYSSQDDLRDSTSSTKKKPAINNASRRTRSSRIRQPNRPPSSLAAEDDGTDDNLHYPLQSSRMPHGTRSSVRTSGHADIQTLQEGAEIAGKVVLLSRGGCGFLEKTKWVQRRGGIALIVGDNTRGGPLVNMYAREDASNITIPSLFTSHTTAHLLASLLPPLEDESGSSPPDGSAHRPSKARHASSLHIDGPTFTPTATTPKQTASSQRKMNVRQGGRGSPSESDDSGSDSVGTLRRFGHILGVASNDAIDSDSRRPPSSGVLDWMPGDELDHEDSQDQRQQKTSVLLPVKTGLLAALKGKKSSTDEELSDFAEDGFVIGVHDWRDPDLVGFQSIPVTNDKSEKYRASSSMTSSRTAASSSPTTQVGLAGDTRTPGSGVYKKPSNPVDIAGSLPRPNSKKNLDLPEVSDSWTLLKNPLHRLSSSQSSDDDLSTNSDSKQATRLESAKRPKISSPHEGLWVTMTPTSVSTSPFFDTILILVVSPLVTLTVVYALLLLRSRIRRRRWRAPKSVVDRLPVRTYHTMSCSSNASQPRTPSPGSESPTSPLLRSTSPSSIQHARPRSQTLSNLRHTESPGRNFHPQTTDEHEKDLPRPKYRGRQLECAVCLEEYVDGQSRVMSLPCGHEFHAECITPWLTTRRRTCPICKGDVVRSMTDAAASSSRQERHSPAVTVESPSSNEAQMHIAEARNESPTASIPINSSLEDSDNEPDEEAAATLRNDHPSIFSPRRGWRALAAQGAAVLGAASPRPSTTDDRNR